MWANFLIVLLLLVFGLSTQHTALLGLNGPAALVCIQVLETSNCNTSWSLVPVERISAFFCIKTCTADRYGDRGHIGAVGAAEVVDEGEQSRHIQYVEKPS